MNKKYLPYIIGLFLLFFIWKIYEYSQQSDFKIENKQHTGPNKDFPGDDNKKEGPVDRNATHIIYTKHARCRMACRYIDESEVKEILKDGIVNYQKSQAENTQHPKYALEGWSHDKQHLRIVFAPEQDGLVVVTCIDLENEFECHCPGDEHKN